MEETTHAIQISPLFSKFLKSNGCYVKYCYYFRKYGQNGLPYFTVASIPWDKTYEGVEYWRKIQTKWIQLLLDYYAAYSESELKLKGS